MPLPPDFSPAEHFQDVARRTSNLEVKEWFADLASDEVDIGTPRSSLRAACTHQENDPLVLTVGRMLLFDMVVRRVWNRGVYGIPVASFQEARRFKPQIMLYFQEDERDVEPGYPPITGEVSFRLMQHTSESITPAIAATYANRIKSEFAGGGGYVWQKGRTMLSYYDREKGYALKVLCRNKSDGRAVISKALDIQNHTPDWKLCKVNENEEPGAAYPAVPQNERIYGKNRRPPRSRPVGDVRFQYALLHVHGLQNPVCLVDRSGTWPDPLVK